MNGRIGNNEIYYYFIFQESSCLFEIEARNRENRIHLHVNSNKKSKLNKNYFQEILLSYDLFLLLSTIFTLILI